MFATQITTINTGQKKRNWKINAIEQTQRKTYENLPPSFKKKAFNSTYIVHKSVYSILTFQLNLYPLRLYFYLLIVRQRKQLTQILF